MLTLGHSPCVKQTCGIHSRHLTFTQLRCCTLLHSWINSSPPLLQTYYCFKPFPCGFVWHSIGPTEFKALKRASFGECIPVNLDLSLSPLQMPILCSNKRILLNKIGQAWKQMQVWSIFSYARVVVLHLTPVSESVSRISCKIPCKIEININRKPSPNGEAQFQIV